MVFARLDATSSSLTSKTLAAGVSVSCCDLSYTVQVKGELKQVLRHVSATFHPGRLAALMGPSGAGKTTLLDILAGRKGRAGEIRGEVLYAGEVVPKRNLKRFCGYVEQANVLLPEFTVEQMLLYTTELKLSCSVSYQDKRKRVDKLIDKLQLESCRKTKIGSTLHRGISGGQARRVSVGLALISHPALLLLDEPTSGLDSKMAAELCAVLKGLAIDGYTLIATVHSPSAPAFACFDDLLLLSNGGEAYAGEVQHVQRHFEGMGFVMPRHSFGFSLPDWLLDVLSKEEDVCELWHNAEREKLQHQGSLVWAASGETLGPGPGKPSQLAALRTMLWYRTGSRYRDLHFLAARFGDKIGLAVVFVSLYWKIGAETELASVQSTCGIFFFLVGMCGFTATGFLPALVLERALFYRERADGLYNSVTYYVAKLIEEAVMSIVIIFLFSLALYSGLDLHGSFWVFAATLYTTNFIGIVVAYAIAAIAPNMEIATATLPAYLASTACVCGFFIMCENMAYLWQCYSAVSFMKYGWALLMLNHFQDHPGGESLYYYKDGELVNVIDFYGMDEGITSSIPVCFAALIGLWSAFVAAGILALAFVTHARR